MYERELMQREQIAHFERSKHKTLDAAMHTNVGTACVIYPARSVNNMMQWTIAVNEKMGNVNG